MVKVNLDLPPDTTFLSEVLYEGLLYLINRVSAEINFKEVHFNPEFLSGEYKELDDGRVDRIRITMAGNDNINARIFEKIGLTDIKSRKTYYDLLKLLKENADRINSKENIDLSIKIAKKDVLMDLNNKKEGISAPQLFKVDRYTGLSSLDMDYTPQQLTLYFSKETALIALLGIYSSYVSSARQQQQNYHYFLFFSPDEIVKMLAEGNRDLIESMFTVKEEASNELRSIIGKYPMNELMIMEISMSVKLQTLLSEHNLDKISLILFKVATEWQSYKIYEQIPITVVTESPFRRAIRGFRDQEKFLSNLAEALSPNGAILTALSTLNKKNKYAEADNILKAVQSLYRFVIIGDVQGWFGFNRELMNAYSKLVNSSKHTERKRAERYKGILAKLGYA